MSKLAIAEMITFPPSSDCENSRWILRHYGVPYIEKPHAAPPFFILAILFHSSRKIPLLLTPDEKIQGLRPLIDHYDRLAAAEKKLIPTVDRDKADALWHEFNGDMGLATVVWAYTGLLPHKDIMIRPLSLHCPEFEQWFTRHLYFIPKLILWRLLKLSDRAAVDALAVLRRKFGKVDRILADGREFLMGDRLTIVDIAFAVSGAPLVLPEGYGGSRHEQGAIPTYEQYPPAMQKVVDEMRETKAGRFVLKMYRQQRYKD